MTSTSPAAEFKVGQVWAYQTRINEADSQLTIVQIDTLKGHEIIHINVSALKIKNPDSPTGYGDEITHLPISRDALQSSITKLICSVEELPDYHEGYQIWREEFDAGDAGVFSIPVAQCVECMEETINQ